MQGVGAYVAIDEPQVAAPDVNIIGLRFFILEFHGVFGRASGKNYNFACLTSRETRGKQACWHQ